MSIGGAYAVGALGAGTAPLAILMAVTEREPGFTRFDNGILGALIAAPLSGGQVRIMLHVIRQTMGYHQEAKAISAADFATALALHPKVVAREVRDLVARGYLHAAGASGRTTAYRVEADPCRWETRNQKVPGADAGEPTGNQKVTGNEMVPSHQKVPGVEPKGSRYPEPKGSPPTIEKEIFKETSKETTEPHGSGVAEAPPPGTLREQFESGYKVARNKGERIGVAGVFFGRMLGPPDYARIGALLVLAKSGGALFNAMAEAARHTITDDPHDYVEAILRRESGKERGDGHDGHRAGGGAGAGAAGPRRGGAAARPGATGGHRTYRDDDLWTQDFRPKE